MKWPKWSIARHSGDFMPILFGCIMLVVSLPPFIMLLFNSEPNAEVVRWPLLIFLGLGTVLGTILIVLGVRICSLPGSLAYRIAHGRICSR